MILANANRHFLFVKVLWCEHFCNKFNKKKTTEQAQKKNKNVYVDFPKNFFFSIFLINFYSLFHFLSFACVIFRSFSASWQTKNICCPKFRWIIGVAIKHFILFSCFVRDFIFFGCLDCCCFLSLKWFTYFISIPLLRKLICVIIEIWLQPAVRRGFECDLLIFSRLFD